MDDPFFFAWLPLVIAIGLAFGSFATALIHRIPLGISWISEKGTATRSACPTCHATLRFYDLIPVFSWLASRGRCRHCGARVSPLYPATELATAAICLALYAAWGPQLLVLPILCAVPFLVTAFVIDWRLFILPDDTNIALAVFGALFVGIAAYMNDWQSSAWLGPVTAALLLPFTFGFAGIVLSKIRRRPALGLGDVKFLAPAGLFLGLAALPSFMVLSGLAGIATGLIRGKGRIDGPFPFGPGLIFSLLVHLFLTGLGFDYIW